MIVNIKAISAIAFLTSTTVSGLENGLRSSLKAKCDEISSATCENNSYACFKIDNGSTYWTVHSWEGSKCSSKCVSDRDLEFLRTTGHKCGPCPACSEEDRCDVDSDKVKYSVFSMKDKDKCEHMCVDEAKVGKFLKDDEYTCGRCPVPVVKPKSLDCADIGEDASQSDLCEKLSPDSRHGDLPSADEMPPKPTKCVMKRGKELMQYWPNYPAQYKNIKIQIKDIATGVVYEFVDGFETDPGMGQFAFQNKTVFEILRNAQDTEGIALQFVSPRGEGGWNTCKYSPIAFDLNRDGRVDIIDKHVKIDITGDGDIEKLREWFGKNEGILIDVKKDIEHFKDKKDYKDLSVTGQHLMGDMGGKYSDGYDKLEEYDDDENGYLEGDELEGFLLWVDANSNARVDKGELTTLEAHGIIAIPTTHDINYEAYAKTKDGEMLMKDLWFAPHKGRRNR